MLTAVKISDSKSMEQNLLSSTSVDYNITDFIPTHGQHAHLSVTAVLSYCKKKILNPYLRLLSIVGLRPLIINEEPCICLQILNHFYTIQIMFLLIMGYFLQYMACFRRDRGFGYTLPNNTFLFKSEVQQIYDQICHGPVVFSFIIPSVLHFAGYLFAVLILRHSDDDQLPVLMERVFLSSTNLSNGFVSQKRLVRILWLFVTFTAIWMVLSLVAVNFMMGNATITFKWVENKPLLVTKGLKIMLVFCTLWHDLVQITVISNYCLQAQLLTSYLHFLQEKLLQCSVQPLEWIRHIENFKKMLKYTNSKIAPSVCIFTFMNISFAVSGLVWFFKFDREDNETLPIGGISILNVILWICIALAPFIQASRLSGECEILRNAGQEVRTRPFVHQDTPGYELDSILLYTSSLKLRAKLFCVPITGKYMWLFFILFGVGILVLGQCHYLNFVY